jgi:hypothetical protein
VTDGDGGFHACLLAFRSAPDQSCARQAILVDN